jgi:peptide deformylase
MSGGTSPLVFIEPKIIETSPQEVLITESCLSFSKSVSYDIYRPTTVTLEYFDEYGNQHLKKFTDMEARVILHEYDHLQGITIYDRWLEKRRE